MYFYKIAFASFFRLFLVITLCDSCTLYVSHTPEWKWNLAEYVLCCFGPNLQKICCKFLKLHCKILKFLNGALYVYMSQSCIIGAIHTIMEICYFVTNVYFTSLKLHINIFHIYFLFCLFVCNWLEKLYFTNPHPYDSNMTFLFFMHKPQQIRKTSEIFKRNGSRVLYCGKKKKKRTMRCQNSREKWSGITVFERENERVSESSWLHASEGLVTVW